VLLLAWYWWFLTAWLLFCAWDNTRLFVKPFPADPRRKKWPFVSILIPARNEEKRIEPCLRGMLKQDYPAYEILVLDDRSTDRTFNLVQAYSKRNPFDSPKGKKKPLRAGPRLKVFKGKELPGGWVGKPWACFQLSQKAKGQWLFFTDADTEHRPDMLKRTLQMAEEKKADVLTLFTRQITKTWMEILVIPVMAYTLLAFLPARWSLRKKSFFNRFAGVSGQFVFIQQKVYRALGGHETVKNEIVEDLNFGKQVVQQGYRLVYGDGSDFSSCRMYTDAAEVWQGFSKNFFPAMAFSPLYFLNAFAVLILDGFAPFIAAALGPSFPLFWPGLALAAVSVGVRWLQAVRYGYHRGSVPFHPLGCLLFALIGLNSVRWFWWRGHGHWKGRKLRQSPIGHGFMGLKS
jgi:chlorobactene glucosyltransferase